MALSPGSRLGAYEILSAIGAGGMGDVYRARDTKLNRDVALKILSDAFASDPDRLARFTREAQTLAALNHPHIAHIHGLEESGGVRALVMELVEGEDLAQRIARGPIPLDDAVPIARQIADALDAAHAQGIIHRDLKPANIKVRSDGTVKVLDFGLAKAMDPLSSSSAAAALAHSPTITSPAAMTAAGIILGTAAYMSPEQARGKVVDKRTDLWAFGCVLFEMLTGRRPFEGEDATEVIAAVVKSDPDWTTLPAAAPPHIVTLIKRCLEKDRQARIGDIAVARFVLADGAALSHAAVAVAAASNPTASMWRRMLPWTAVGALATGLAVVVMLWAPWRKALPAEPVRLSAELGGEVAPLSFGLGQSIGLSRDGSLVAFVARKGTVGSSQLYLRRLAQLQATPLTGTDAPDSPFFSPDGQWIGFFAGGKLKKIATTGGAAVVICDAPLSRGGAWAEDGTIVFAPNTLGSLMRVSSTGGTPEPLTSLAEGEVSQRWPQLLAGGKAVLFTGSGAIGSFDDANLVVQMLPTGARTVVQRGGYHGRYLPSGHLLYVNSGTLFAAPFDLDRLAVTGPPVPALEGGVTSNDSTGSALFAVSASGTLAYMPGQSTSGGRPIHWMDHEGTMTPLRATAANWVNPQFSPDGRRLALQINEGSTNDIWVEDWTRDTLARLTSDPAADTKPVWTPDGRRIVFSSGRADQATPNLYIQRADGTGDAQRLTESRHPQQPASWHPSGKFLAFEEMNQATNWDLMVLPIEGDEASGWRPGKPIVFLSSQSAEREPMFSPDGRWLAYISDETGRQQVYVRPFPGPGGKWTISTGSGLSPTWSRTKRELFYALGDQMMVVSYEVDGDSFRAEKPRLWSERRFVMRGLTRTFDLHPDGTRFALAPNEQPPLLSKRDHLEFFFNFFDELRRLAPAGRR